MGLPIFYLEEFTGNNTVELNEETSRHIVQVLRMQEGSQIQLTDGRGRLMDAEITAAHKKKTLVKILRQQSIAPSENKITIAISPIKNTSRFEWFLEKATEIGVNEIIPLICQRTEKEKLRTDRLQQIIISAMLQSQQVWLPVLHEQTIFKNVLANATHENKFIAHCEDGEKNDFFYEVKESKSSIILIGPEGDFTTDEIREAIQKNFTPVSLGENRLRTETAGVVAATLLRFKK